MSSRTYFQIQKGVGKCIEDVALEEMRKDEFSKKRRLKAIAVPTENLPKGSHDRIVNETLSKKREKRRNRREVEKNSLEETIDVHHIDDDNSKKICETEAAEMLLELARKPLMPPFQHNFIKTFEDKAIQFNTFEEYQTFDGSNEIDNDHKLLMLTELNSLLLHVLVSGLIDKTSTNKLAVELAIGGQTISQLHKRLKRCQCPSYAFELGHKITILIGSNDILKDHLFTIMRNGITRLLSQLNTSRVNDIRIMTIPPLLSGSKLQQKKIKYFNNFLLKLRYPNVTVIDFYHSIQDQKEDFFRPYRRTTSQLQGSGVNEKPDHLILLVVDTGSQFQQENCWSYWHRLSCTY
ncbi:hypothetical protein FQR65_LT16725 [Abscondita terminalis]|nr:hypothetical protein FQR65_LT16725 [Abscondita terminalis]